MIPSKVLTQIYPTFQGYKSNILSYIHNSAYLVPDFLKIFSLKVTEDHLQN